MGGGLPRNVQRGQHEAIGRRREHPGSTTAAGREATPSVRLDGVAVGVSVGVSIGVSVGVSVGVAICVVHCPVLAAAPPPRIGGLGLRAEQQRHEQV